MRVADSSQAPTQPAAKAGAVVGADDHRVKGDLERFKEFIEKRGSATGSWQGGVQQD